MAAASLALCLALSKLGIAMAARRIMIATTIIISTKVKPLFECLISSNPPFLA
jgi:hypothetical protein